MRFWCVSLLFSLGLAWGQNAPRFVFWPGVSYDPAVPEFQKVLGYAPGERISSHANLIRFMEALEAGKTFAEAETETNTFLQGTGGLLNPAGAEIRIEYGSGYDSSMTLEQARQQHRGP